MVEQSYLFDFTRVNDFIENINIGFFIDEMWKVTGVTDNGYTYTNTGTDCFELVVCSYGGNNIEDYLDENGYLLPAIVSSSIIQSCALDFYNRGDGEATIELHGNVTFNIGDNQLPLKAIFLRSKSTGYVMGYSINMQSFTITNRLVFDDDVIFWDITRYNNND